MTARNFDRARSRDRVRRQGSEDKGAEEPFMVPLLPPMRTPKPRVDKADLRAQGAKAFADWRARQARDGK
jgi:hypothetical protein